MVLSLSHAVIYHFHCDCLHCHILRKNKKQKNGFVVFHVFSKEPIFGPLYCSPHLVPHFFLLLFHSLTLIRVSSLDNLFVAAE